MEPSGTQETCRRRAPDAAFFGRIAFGAVGAVVLLCALHFGLPQLRILTKMLLPLPVALTYILFGPAVVLAATGGACLLIWGFVSLQEALAFAAGGALLGLILGEHALRGRSAFHTIAIGTLAVSAITLIALQMLAPGSIVPGDEAAFNGLFAGNLDANSPNVLEQLKSSVGEETADKAVHWLMLLLPSLVVIGELLYTIIGFVGFRGLVKRIFGVATYQATSEGEFRLWHAPDKLVFGLIGVGAFLLLATGLPFRIALNCMVVLGCVYVIQGFAVALFFAGRFISSRSFQWIVLLIILLALRLLFFLMAAAVGFLDVFMDFRKVRARNAKEEQQSAE